MSRTESSSHSLAARRHEHLLIDAGGGREGRGLASKRRGNQRRSMGSSGGQARRTQRRFLERLVDPSLDE